jgi:intein/homing endonuclease
MIAADTKLETPEGPLTIKTVGASPTSVMTRTDDGMVRFAMTTDVRKVADAQPVLRITLENGRALRVAADQILLRDGLQEVRAGDLRPGDELLSNFAFPSGYEYRTDGGETRVSNGTVKVAAVEPGGDADLYSLKVPRTNRFVFSSGVIGKC